MLMLSLSSTRSMLWAQCPPASDQNCLVSSNIINTVVVTPWWDTGVSQTRYDNYRCVLQGGSGGLTIGTQVFEDTLDLYHQVVDNNIQYLYLAKNPKFNCCLVGIFTCWQNNVTQSQWIVMQSVPVGGCTPLYTV